MKFEKFILKIWLLLFALAIINTILFPEPDTVSEYLAPSEWPKEEKKVRPQSDYQNPANRRQRGQYRVIRYQNNDLNEQLPEDDDDDEDDDF